MLLLALASSLLAGSASLPAIEVATQSGTVLNLAAWQGRPVVVTFWATWCAPCREDLAALERIAARPDADVAVLTIAVDTPGWKTVLPFLRQQGYDLPTTILTPRLRKAFPVPPDVSPLPQTLFFGPSGRLAAYVRGALTEDELSRILSTLSVSKPPKVAKKY